MIGRRLRQYEVLAKLGEGGMGVVYKARDVHLERFAAIKVLPPAWVADPERKQRFTREAKAASALNHPGIVTVYEITHADGTDFIAMEFVPGQTLADLIARKRLSLMDTLAYAIQAAQALAKAHATGIVHRDLKPSNIMVTDDGLVKILDFGVAKLASFGEVEADREAETSTMRVHDRLQTAAGTTVGTIAYMSPEQAEGRPVDARSDIFSFGAVLYEMVTGARAFQGSSPAATLAAVIHDEPTPPSQLAKNLPRDLERVIQRCLRKDPARRFHVLTDLAVELDEIKADVGTRPSQGPVPAVRPRRGGRLAVFAAAAAIVVTSAAGWFAWRSSSFDEPAATITPLTSLAGDERYPTFSPDGGQVAFTWDGERGENTDIYVMPVGAGTPLRLTTDPALDTAPAWSPDGSRVAFLRRDGPRAALYVLTPPLPNSEQKIADVQPSLLGGNELATVSWLADNRHIILAERDPNTRENGIVVVPTDRSAPRRLIWTATSAGTYHFPAVSPTNNSLAYAFCAGEYSCEVYVIDLDAQTNVRGSPRRLSEQNDQSRTLAWTADGRFVISSFGSVARFFLWRFSVSGEKAERLELAGDHATHLAVSSDGRTLAYARLGNDADIWRFRSGGVDDFVWSTLDERNAQFSPDGRKVAFESRRLGFDTQLWLANADGTNAAPLTEGLKGIGGSPRWSPDSRRVVFDAQDADGRRAVYVVDAEGGRANLFVKPGLLPSWSQDGEWIYFNDSRTGRQEIWRKPVSGGAEVQVTDNGGGNQIESPDGTMLYYRKAPLPGVLFGRPVAGGPERRVLDTMLSGVHQFYPMDDGVYYLCAPNPKAPFAREIRFLDFKTDQHETLHQFESRGNFGLAVSPDRKTILYSGTKPAAGDDLVVIRNFR
jgi:serine/threonine protein kinase/Tol biopolymer transport system component